MAEVPPQRPEAFTGSSQEGEEAWLPRVLLVDDSVSNLRTLTQGLRHECKLLVANRGEVALELAEREQPDLILLDVVMEGMDGHETCRRLKAHPRTRGIPVIFITGKREEVDEIRGFELGAVDYITKPFSLPLVQQRIRTQLELKRYRDQLERQALLDGLTGIPNRRRFQEFLDYVGGLAVRQGAPLSVILLDVDQFKAYNDHYGHPAGDEVLRRVARALVLTKRRTTDLVARYGGEEFVAVLPDTDAEGAGLVAEAMRASVEALAIPHAHSGTGGRLTLSLGVATWQGAMGGDPLTLLKAADQALYRAKQGGRNRVSV
ncbi:MAG: diguanylate cyclase [Acidobacteria bacterium]|nr:diguanylate cyclase [Acidobacteriota bacterium]